MSRETSERVERDGRIRRLTVAVAVRQGAPLRPADLAAIERLVRSAVGFDAARGDAVSVVARPFTAPRADPPAPWWEAGWLPLALRAGATLLAAIVALVAIRRLLRRPAPDPALLPPPAAARRVPVEDVRAVVTDDRRTAARALRQLLSAPSP